jgi:hypothetical protein
MSMTYRRPPPAGLSTPRPLRPSGRPAGRRRPGLRPSVGPGDRAPGRGAAITLWDPAAPAAGLRDALAALGPQLQALGLQFEAPEVHPEVLLHAQV